MAISKLPQGSRKWFVLIAVAGVISTITTAAFAASNPFFFNKNAICVALFTTHSLHPGVKSTQKEQKAFYDQTTARFDEQLATEVRRPKAPRIRSLSLYSNDASPNDLRDLMSHREALEHASLIAKEDSENTPDLADDTRFLQIQGAEEIAAFLQASHELAAELSRPIPSGAKYTLKEGLPAVLVISLSRVFAFGVIPYWAVEDYTRLTTQLLDFANGNVAALAGVPLSGVFGAFWAEKTFRAYANLSPFAEKKFQQKMRFLEQLSNGGRGWYYESTQNRINLDVIKVVRSGVPEVLDNTLNNWHNRLHISESGRETKVGTAVAKYLFRRETNLDPEVWIDQLLSTDPSTGTPLLTIRIQTIKKRPAMPKTSKKPVEEKGLMPDWLPESGR